MSDPMLGRYWCLACSQCVDYLVLESSVGQFLAHKERFFVPKALVLMVLHEFHDAHGHFGVNHTYAMIAEWYYWPHMGDEVRRHSQHCDICQSNKSNTRKVASLYQPLPVPQAPCQHIHIDFITDLPEDCSYHTIMMVVNHFSKMVVLAPLQSMDVDTIADAFFCQVIGQHGLPLMIMTDQD